MMTDVTAEDSGNYTCEVRGSNSAVLANVTHYVFVRGIVLVLRLHTLSKPFTIGAEAKDVAIAPLPSLYFAANLIIWMSVRVLEC